LRIVSPKFPPILYDRWPEKLLAPAKQLKKQARRPANPEPARLDHSIIF
jgi:hypothetical protein